MSTQKNVYAIDRKEASESLKVSLRTLDRYIKRGLINYHKVENRVLLNKNEIEKFKKRLSRFEHELAQKHELGQKNEFTQKHEFSQEYKRSLKYKMPHEESKAFETPKKDEENPEKIFQNLYLELLKEIKTQQTRLEGANYRVGHLEAMLKNSIPLLDYQSESLKVKQQEKELENQLEKKSQEIKKLNYDLKIEKVNKLAYIIVLFLILVAQPILWFLVTKK